MPKLTLAGHPLHPQIVPFPAALLPFSFAMDLAYLSTRRRSYADAAYYSMVGGVLTGLLAGAAGAADFAAIPKDAPVRKMARLHGLLNVSILALYGFNLLQRRRRRRPSTGLVALSGACASGLLVSAWYGAHMVYVHGLRVLGRGPVAEGPEIAPPGDAAVTRALESVPEHV
jgi:uncharacterized membrane protein